MMIRPENFNFSKANLHDRSFQDQDLTGADFCRSNLHQDQGVLAVKLIATGGLIGIIAGTQMRSWQ